jgi:hypothetical protein
MNKIFIFTIIFALLCSIYSFAEEDCTTKYQDLRNRVSGIDGGKFETRGCSLDGIRSR